MPGLTSLPLNLSDILEARKSPLRELEIWALLSQCADALQDLVIKGQVFGDNAFRPIITPNGLLIQDNGTILTENVPSSHGSLYMAPEYDPESQHPVSDAAFEKMYIFSLGRTLQVASEFGLQENEVLGISYDLDSLLQAMSDKSAAFRLSLSQVLEACHLQASQHPNKLPHTLVLSRLYKSVLGGQHKRSFNDSNYESENSHELAMSKQPGRARRPRPLVRHRHMRRRKRDGSQSSSASPVSRSRSRSRSRNQRTEAKSGGARVPLTSPDLPVGSRTDLSAQAVTTASNTPTASQILNTSMVSSSSEMSAFGKMQRIPPYSAAHSVQGLLGLRQGSPAYQKYIKLKERQMRLRQAKSGQALSAMDEVRSRLMTPPLMSMEMMDNMSETYSMASLMSYTLGTYKPYLHAEFGSEAALNFANEPGADTSSQMSLMFAGMDYGQPLRAQAVPITSSQVLQDAPKPKSPTPKRVHRAEDITSAVPEDLQSSLATQADSLKTPASLPSQSEAKPSPTNAPKVNYSPAKIGSPKKKDFVGPEFVENLKKPAVHVAMPLQGDSIKNASLARKVTVVHLTGRKFDIVLDPSSTCRQLYDTVIPYLELDDFFFFGLTYIAEGEHFFLDADTKLHKVAPEGWREGPKGHQSHVAFALNVRVKFYPESLIDFRHVSSQHLLYLQLRRDVVEERVVMDPELLFKLAGVALQAEYGDHTTDMEGSSPQGVLLPPYFTVEYYIPARVLRQTGASVVYTKVISKHKASAGMSAHQAEMEFIKLVRNLPEYGIHFHKLFKTKAMSGMQIWVGLSQHSFVVAEPSPTVTRIMTQGHPWNSLLKISFNKRRFSVQPKVEGVRGKPPKINFYTNSYRKGRYLLLFSTEQHRYEIRMKTRPSHLEAVAGNAVEEEAPQMVDSGVGEDVVGDDFSHPLPTAHVDGRDVPLPDDEDQAEAYETEEMLMAERERSYEQPLRYRSPPSYQPPPMAEILGGDQVFPGTEVSRMHASLADLHSSEFDKHHLQTLLDMSSRTQGLDSVSASNNVYRVASPGRPLTEEETISPAGRRIFEVSLDKEPGHGVGITIVGGETTSSLDLGIFVKSVVPGGPADKDGRIKSGDRLIAIGGRSLEGKQHHEAVAMIRDSGPTVAFLVSQVRPPGTVKKRQTSLDQQAEFERKLRDSMSQCRIAGSDDEDEEFHNPHGEFFVSGDPGEGDNVHDSLLSFDDFLYSNHKPHHTLSESDPQCYSDEENYPLEPPYSTTLPVQGNQKHNTHTHHSPHLFTDQKASEADLLRNNSLRTEEEPVRLTDNPDNRVKQSDFLSPLEGNEELELKLQEAADLARELEEESRDMTRDTGIPNSMEYQQALLTEEEQEDLQILGDIAALDEDGSSSDSDFDSAIKKTIDGPNNKILPTNKAVNTVSPMVYSAPGDRTVPSDGAPLSDVVYEVILERDVNGLGIVIDHPVIQEEVPNGVYIRDILQGSPADRGGVLMSGDRVIEVAGVNVVNKDSKTVEDLLKTSPSLTTVKISRPLEKDVELHYRGLELHDNEFPHQLNKGRQDRLHNSLLPQGHKGGTHPSQDELYIVPPPPLPLSRPIAESESNTQSDVDSDVLDSSKSDIDDLAMFAVHEPLQHLHGHSKRNVTDNNQVDPDNWSSTSDTLKLEGSDEEFDEKLNALKNALDEQEQLAVENNSPLSLSRSSRSSSTDSVVRSPRKLIESLGNRARDGEIDEDHDDDDDVVVTMFGDKPAVDGDNSKAGTRHKKGEKEEIMDPFEPVLLSVSVKRLREGFGFTVAGGVSTGGCYIKQLVSEPAISDGRIRPGDKIIQVNGHDTTSMGHVETVSLLRQIHDVANMQLLRFPSTMETQERVQAAQAQAQSASAKAEPREVVEATEKSERSDGKASPKVLIHPYNYKASITAQAVTLGQEGTHKDKKARGNSEAGIFRVELNQPKDSTAALGIVLSQLEKESQTFVCVKRIKPGSLASEDGRLQKGDIILQANGTSFVGITVREAVLFLRETKGKVIFTISRPEESPESDGIGGDESDHDVTHVPATVEDAATIENVTPSPADRPGSRVSEQYDSWRKPDSDVPVILTDEWLNNLPLMRMAVGEPTNHVRGVLQTLAELVESGEPTEAFKSIRQLKEAGPCRVGKLPENKQKNKYRNVLPYDFNRVPLLGREEGNDYINASYIEMPLMSYAGSMPSLAGVVDDETKEMGAKDKKTDGGSSTTSSTKCLKYIACQGPVESTVGDMWALIWQEKVHVVAMLTQTQEGNKLKCYPYWPRSKADVLTVNDGALRVQLVRSYGLADLHVIQVVVEEAASGLREDVTLLQYLAWPDHGAPDTALPLLRLLQVMHLLESGSPPVVHCSAGIGRSGAMIAVDVALACIEHGVEFNLYDIVCKLRKQRQGMVQTTDQYLFCYTACMEALLSMDSG